MDAEIIEIPWKTFADELPALDTFIWVTPPKKGFLSASMTVLRPNYNNKGGQNSVGYNFHYGRQFKYLKRRMNWKWCYKSDIKASIKPNGI